MGASSARGFTRVGGPDSPVFAGTDAAKRVNAGFIRTSKGTVVVDALVTRDDGRELVAAAQELAGPVTTLVFTHEHADHTIGSTDFPPGGVIASDGTARGIEADIKRSAEAYAAEGIDPKRPTLVFDNRIRLPWQPEIVVVELGGHAEGSSVVLLPEERVLFTGDLVFRGRPPWVGGIRPEKWLAALRVMEGWGAKTVVPGHGDVGGPEMLVEQREWLERFLAKARELREAGTPVDRAVEVLAGEFGYADRQRDNLRLGLVKRLGFEA